MKSFADDNLDAASIIKCVIDKVENIVAKRENAGFHHFLLFSQCLNIRLSRHCAVKGQTGGLFSHLGNSAEKLVEMPFDDARTCEAIFYNKKYKQREQEYQLISDRS